MFEPAAIEGKTEMGTTMDGVPATGPTGAEGTAEVAADAGEGSAVGLAAPAGADPQALQPRQMQQQLARWAKEDRVSMRYGAPALLTGWFVTFFVFCLGLTVATMIFTGGDSGLGWYFLPISLVYGFPVAAVIGLPLAILIASPLRRVRGQRLHVLAFSLSIGAVMAAICLIFFFRGDGVLFMLALIVWTAVCAAVGRAVVVPLVARRNEMPSQPPTRPSLPLTTP